MSSRSLPRTAFFTGLSKGVEAAGSIGATFIVARYLGPAGYGVYAQVVSTVMMLWPLVDMGLDHVVVRELVGGAKKEGLVGSALAVRFGAGVAVSVGLMGWAVAFGGRELVGATALAALNLLLVRQVSNLVCRAFFLGVERVENDAIATALGQVVRLGGLVVACRAGWGLLGVLSMPIAAEFVQIGCGVVLARRFCESARIRADAVTARHLFRESWSILLRLILVTAYFHIDNVILARLLSPADLGLFAAPFRLVTGVVMVAVPTAWAVLPSLVRERQGTGVIGRVGPLATAATALVGAGFVVAAGPLITLTFGSALQPAVLCVRALALLPALHTIAYVAELDLLAKGRQQWALIGAAPALLVKVVVDVAFAARLGPLTGAASSLAADLLRVALLAWVSRARWIASSAVPLGALGILVAASVLGGCGR